MPSELTEACSVLVRLHTHLFTLQPGYTPPASACCFINSVVVMLVLGLLVLVRLVVVMFVLVLYLRLC